MTTGCEHEMFGIDCNTHCSGHCLDKGPCNSTNGHCDSGCASGYLEAFCNKSKYFRKLQETAYDACVMYNVINLILCRIDTKQFISINSMHYWNIWTELYEKLFIGLQGWVM